MLYVLTEEELAVRSAGREKIAAELRDEYQRKYDTAATALAAAMSVTLRKHCGSINNPWERPGASNLLADLSIDFKKHGLKLDV